jgi:hypothetical protein
MATDQMQGDPTTYGDPQMSAQGPGMIPQVNPVAPPPPDPGTDPMMQQMVQNSQMGGQAFGSDEARRQALAQQLSQARGEQQTMADPANQPKRGLMDEPWMKMQPVKGQGFGHDAGNLLGDIGKALLMGLSSSGIGQNVQEMAYGPGIARYNTQKAAKAAQIESLQKQFGEEGTAEGAASGMVSKPLMAGASLERAAASTKNADTNAKREAMQQTQGLEKLKQGWDRLSIADKTLKAKQWFDQAVIRVSQARVDAGMDENAARVQAQEDVKSAASQDAWVQTHPILDMLGLKPDIQAAAGAQPTKTATRQAAKPNAPRGAAPVPAGTVVYDPAGKPHKSNGSAPLPSGWSLTKPK